MHPFLVFTNITLMQATTISQLNYYKSLLTGPPGFTSAPYFKLFQTVAKMNF